jgi:hypothetical protein
LQTRRAADVLAQRLARRSWLGVLGSLAGLVAVAAILAAKYNQLI